jgi:hypothetical protein
MYIVLLDWCKKRVVEDSQGTETRDVISRTTQLVAEPSTSWGGQVCFFWPVPEGRGQ